MRNIAFESRPDGEYALCRPCQRAGYGEDSWHPITSEFWPTQQGRLLLYRCKACQADAGARHRSMKRRAGMAVANVQTVLEMRHG